MIQKILLIFLFTGIWLTGKPTDNPKAGARQLALSSAWVASSDVWSTFYNQAGLSEIRTTSGAVFYTSLYGLKDLSQMAATAMLPVNSGVFGLSFSQFGHGQFKETKAGLAFAKNLGVKFSAAIQADFYSMKLPENERGRSAWTFETGIRYKPSERLFLGAHLLNPVRSGIKTFGGISRIPTTVCLGGNYIVTEMLNTNFELEKSQGTNVRFKSGTEFFALKNLALRFGFSLWPFAYTTGIGYSFGKFTTDIGFSYTGNLGVTPSVSIGYRIK
jgi:hypothetical protein